MIPMLEIAGVASCNLPRSGRRRLVVKVMTVGCRMSALEGPVLLATGVSPMPLTFILRLVQPCCEGRLLGT
jgi:hypothetical protein